MPVDIETKYVLINCDGKYATVSQPSTHGETKYKMNWVNDLNKADVHTKGHWLNFINLLPFDSNLLPAVETRKVSLQQMTTVIKIR